jgi:hypothetical protein
MINSVTSQGRSQSVESNEGVSDIANFRVGKLDLSAGSNILYCMKILKIPYMMRKLIITSFSIGVIVGIFCIQVTYGQLNQCTLFEGRALVVVRVDNDCLGFADAKMTDGGWTIIGINNVSIYMEKHGNQSN